MTIKQHDLIWLKNYMMNDEKYGKTEIVSELASWFGGKTTELWNYAIKEKYVIKVKDSIAFGGFWKATPKLENLNIE